MHASIIIVSAATLLALTGCAASLDPSIDIDHAERTAAARLNPPNSADSPQWSAGWNDSLATFDPSSPLSEQQAIALALRANRQLRADIEQIASSRADLVQAGLLPNPVLSLTLRFPADAASTGTFIGAQAVQSFAALWLRPSRVAAADARLNASVLKVSDRALDLAAQVRSALARAGAGKALATIAQERADTLAELVTSQELRQRAGAASALDGALARTRAAQGASDLAIAKRDAAIARRELLELMGMASASADFPLAPDTEGAAAPLVASLTESEAMSLAQSQRLDIAAAREVARSHSADLNTAERSRLDGLAIGADFERSEAGESTIGPTLEVPIPIFDTGAARIAKAGSEARAALFTAEAVAQRATREVRAAWITADAAARLEASTRETLLPAAERAAALAESAQRAGEADTLLTLGARLDILEARRTAAQTALDHRLALIALARASGL